MPQTARQRRTAAANRARVSLPRRRRRTAAETLARRGSVVLGILIVVALIVAIVANYDSGNSTTAQPGATVDPRGDPKALIAAATANPQDPNAISDLADYYDQTGQYANALPLYQRYLQLRPDDARVHVSTGELLLAQGDTQGAQTQFTQTLALKPDAQAAARAHLGLGNAYAALNPPRLSDALNELMAAASLDPDGEIGSAARDRLAGIQQQYGIATVTVAIPTLPPVTVVTQP